VPEHQSAPQLRARRDARGDPRRGAAVRPEDQRRDEAVEGERGGVHTGRRGGAVEEVTAASRRLLESLVTSAPPRDREIEAAKAKARAAARFA
jgi:hypothetical protein